MPYFKKSYDFAYYICEIQLLKILHDIGIYDEVCAGIKSISEDDYYEMVERSMECVAPIFSCDDVPIGGNEEEISGDKEIDYYCDHYHRVYTFSDPAMQEYYALCRAYELRHSLEPEDNPFVKEADDFSSICFRAVNGYFHASFNHDKYSSGFVIESCPDYSYDELSLILEIHNALEFYRKNLMKLRLEILTGTPLSMPLLSAPKGAEIV